MFYQIFAGIFSFKYKIKRERLNLWINFNFVTIEFKLTFSRFASVIAVSLMLNILCWKNRRFLVRIFYNRDKHS